MAIECQGIQHFKLVSFTSKDSKEEILISFNKIKNNDIKKYNLCKDNNIKILYYSDVNYKKFLSEKIIHSLDELLNYIKQYKNI